MAIWLHDLDDIIAPTIGNGVTDLVIEPGWMTRARSSGGLDSFDGALWHHTVSGTNDRANVNYICYGNPYAPSPVSQLYIGRDGRVWLLAAGAANHGGSGGAWVPGGPKLVDVNRANTRLLGVEMANWGNGIEVWPWRQIMAAITVAAAISIAEGWDASRHFAHKEYCGPGTTTPGRKADPLGPWENHPDGYWPNGSSWGAGQDRIDTFRLLVATRIRELQEDPMQLITDPPVHHFYDTRVTSGARFMAGETRRIPMGVTGRAITINLTVTEPAAPGWVTAWGSGLRPGSSKLNHGPGQTIANEVMVPLASDGSIQVFSLAAADIIVDRVAVWS